MLPGEGERLVDVGVDLHSRAPFHGGLLAPQSRDGPTGLDVAGHPHAVSFLEESDDVLSLHEVGNIALTIDATDNESSTGAATVLLGDQSEVVLQGP